ncbi:hypothetical protein BDV93DRAFT_529645 [Ceratobasidium sp. AG-I]|nr:hypothetical protein BDV93DRAFT_529741 [Ceratobasidium sp. AG-I]KAF8593848.1 hypothetical protein BDV93DRAFT_529645 [Ceratobasidium sp. AG-I]
MPRDDGHSNFNFPSFSSQPQYCQDFTARPAPNPTSLAAVNPIVFPNINTQVSPTEKRSGSDYSDDSVHSLRSPVSPTLSYRPRTLSYAMLNSPNANDHLRRIHVTSARYCKKRAGGERFIIFHIIDSALPQVSNILILGRNGRHEVVRGNAQQQSAGCCTFVWRPMSLLRWCIGRTSLRPGRFYVSNTKKEESFLSQAGFNDYEMEESLSWSIDPTFSLDHLLVLASSLTSLSRFRHPSVMQSPDWYPISLWEAIRQLPRYIESEEPIVGVAFDNVLLANALAKHPGNMRKFHNRVISRQQSEDSDRAVSDRRQRDIEAELERSRGQIELQRLESHRLGRERDALAQEQQEMRIEIEKLKQKLASDVYRT